MVARTGALRAKRRYGFGYVPSYRPDLARPPPNRVRHPSSVNLPCASAPSRPRGRAPFSAASRLLEYTAGPPVSPVVVRDFAGSVASGEMGSGHPVRCSGPVARSVVGSAFGARTPRPVGRGREYAASEWFHGRQPNAPERRRRGSSCLPTTGPSRSLTGRAARQARGPCQVAPIKVPGSLCRTIRPGVLAAPDGGLTARRACSGALSRPGSCRTPGR